MKNELIEIKGVKEIAMILREEIQTLADDVGDLFNNENHMDGADEQEAEENIMLVYRHLEDAKMRLGKVIQAEDGGVSCYDIKLPNGGIGGTGGIIPNVKFSK